MKRSQRWNTLQICPRRDSNTGGSDLWSNTLPLDHGGALESVWKKIVESMVKAKIISLNLILVTSILYQNPTEWVKLIILMCSINRKLYSYWRDLYYDNWPRYDPWCGPVKTYCSSKLYHQRGVSKPYSFRTEVEEFI